MYVWVGGCICVCVCVFMCGSSITFSPLYLVIQRLPLNDNNLRRAWECSSRSTKEDWAEWMRHFSVELLKESPSPALRACHAIALV